MRVVNRLTTFIARELRHLSVVNRLPVAPLAWGASASSTSREMMLKSIDRRLFDELERLGRHCVRRNDDILWWEQEHSLAELRVLRVVAYAAGPHTATRVARALGCTKANVSKLANRLARSGHLSRTRDPKDARAVLLRVTPAGALSLGGGDEEVSVSAVGSFRALDEEEKERLLALLQKVASLP